ncbi:MAG: MBL fold metallo-hydrolase, partial [Mucilaginibacter sp.]
MSLFISSLNSGSNGNCYYIGNGNEAVLIDAGISCRETEKRMQRLNLSMLKVKAIFVSHEHTDHISGVMVLSKKYNLPVYITTGTLNNCRLVLDEQRTFPFIAYETIKIGDLLISAFPKFHDAAHPHSFIIECRGVKVGVLTDIGAACKHVLDHFSQCHAAF